jgi:hypothetical protein
MEPIHITVHAGQLALSAPYDPAMPAKARKIGGRFSSGTKLWTFDARDEQRVRELCIEIYGTDGSTADQPGLTIRIPVNTIQDTWDQELRLAGRRLAWRPNRDDAVRLGDGVILASGGWDSRGGSVKNPRLEPAEDGTVLEVRDVPPGQAMKMLANARDSYLVDDPSGVLETLRAERQQLVERLAEIDAQLATLGG